MENKWPDLNTGVPSEREFLRKWCSDFYAPTVADFQPKIPVGTSLLTEHKANQGRTKRERDKQRARINRRYTRDHSRISSGKKSQ